jgi:hypothetical protein
LQEVNAIIEVPCNMRSGHTLTAVLDHLRQGTGIAAKRVQVDRGYRGHGHDNPFRIWITAQVRNVTRTIRREMKRRAAIEPMIGHIKAEHRMGRNYPKGRGGDRINAILAAAGFNFHPLLRWFADFLRRLLYSLIAVIGIVHGRLLCFDATVLAAPSERSWRIYDSDAAPAGTMLLASSSRLRRP